MTDWLYPISRPDDSGSRVQTPGANRSTPVASKTSPAGDTAALKQACSQMESLFLNYLFKAMRATVPESGLLGDRRSEKIYTSMLDDRLAREMTSDRGIGLAAILHRQLRAEVPGDSSIEQDPETGPQHPAAPGTGSLRIDGMTRKDDRDP